jgi:hypothetical protein
LCELPAIFFRSLLLPVGLLFFHDQHGVELVCGNLIERQPDAELQRRAKIQCPAKELADF